MSFHIGNANTSQPRERFLPNPKLKLLEQVSEVMRFKHYSLRTETTYREWNREQDYSEALVELAAWGAPDGAARC